MKPMVEIPAPRPSYWILYYQRFGALFIFVGGLRHPKPPFLRALKLMIGFTSAILTSSKNYCCDATPVISEIFNLPSWPKH